MTAKRNKGPIALDPPIPILTNHRTDQEGSNQTNIDRPKSKDQIDDISKIATSVRPKFEILRANSPTFKRLVAVRVKLEKYVVSQSNTITPTEQPLQSETSHLDKPSTATAARISSQKRVQSKRKPRTAPLDKITYEKTWTNNGNVKQKCSLEIWLPKAGSDDDDGNLSQVASPDPHTFDNESHSPQSPSMKSRRSSAVKFSLPITVPREAKSLDDLSMKKLEPVIMPRVYHYQDQPTEQTEERPHSGRTGNTNPSDASSSNKTIKHHRTRGHRRHLSPSTNNTDESIHSAASVLPMSSKNLLANLKQTYANQESKGTLNSNHSPMINELMRKYSMMKKSHQELTQPRLQLEKPYYESKNNTHTMKDHSHPPPPSQVLPPPPLPPPPVLDPTSQTSTDQPIVSVRKLLVENSTTHSGGDNTSAKALERYSTHRRPPHVDAYPQARLFSIVNNLQHRQVSASIPTAILPAVVGKKNEEPFRSFERSKTLDVVFALPHDHSTKIPSRLPIQLNSSSESLNTLPRTINGNEQISHRLLKRSVPPPSHIVRSERTQQQQQHQQQQHQQITRPLVQLLQYQNIQNTAQRYHLSTHSPASLTTTDDVSTNRVFVHLKYSNGGHANRHCLIPE